MRITYLHQYFNTRAAPSGARSYEFARRLVARGHTVHMVTSLRRDAEGLTGWQESEVNGIHVHAIPVPYNNAMSYRQRITAFLRYAWHAARRAASLPCDVVFATSTPLTIALPAVYAARRRRVPMVFEVRDLWPEMPIAVGALRGALPIWAARCLERFAYRHATRVVALSPGMRDGVVAAGYPAERVHVIPNSSDLDLFAVPAERGERFRRDHEWLQQRPLVLYAGTFGLVNGVGYLVDLAAHMRALSREVRFLLVGTGRERDAVRQRAEHTGVLNGNLFMMEPVSRADLPMLLSAAIVATSTVIDVPALWSNSANKFFDALAAGRPVAINYEGWQADLLRETGAGLVLPARDPRAAAELLAGFLADGDRVARAGEAARRLAEARFSRDLLFEEFERVLLLAIEEPGL